MLLLLLLVLLGLSNTNVPTKACWLVEASGSRARVKPLKGLGSLAGGLLGPLLTDANAACMQPRVTLPARTLAKISGRRVTDATAACMQPTMTLPAMTLAMVSGLTTKMGEKGLGCKATCMREKKHRKAGRDCKGQDTM